MHILFLTDNFPPEVNAPASRTYEHAREWVRAGHRVTVITGAPNFPKGKVFDGYRNRIWQTEDMDGIRVVRVWTYIAANEGFARRILDYVSFMIAATLAAPLVRQVNVVIGTSPQFFTACAAYLISRLKRIPFIFELRDLWPESIKVVGAMRDSLAMRILERVELFLYCNASAIVSVTHSFKHRLVERGIAAGRIHVVTNGVDIHRFRPQVRDPELARQLGLTECFVVGYVGTHGLAHGLETILEAAELIRAEPSASNVRFLLLGDGARKAELVSSARERGLANVTFLDSVSKDEVVRYWSLLDLSVIHLRKAELFATVIPSKLFESMGMGLPVLLGVAGESADIVERDGVGIVFEPGNARELCRAVMWLRNDPSARQRLAESCLKAARRYDRRALAMTMLEVVQSVCRAP